MKNNIYIGDKYIAKTFITYRNLFYHISFYKYFINKSPYFILPKIIKIKGKTIFYSKILNYKYSLIPYNLVYKTYINTRFYQEPCITLEKIKQYYLLYYTNIEKQNNLIDYLLRVFEKNSFCTYIHGDIHSQNCLYKYGKYYLIDYELSFDGLPLMCEIFPYIYFSQKKMIGPKYFIIIGLFYIIRNSINYKLFDYNYVLEYINENIDNDKLLQKLFNKLSKYIEYSEITK